MLSVFLARCGKENPVPAYVHIPAFTLTTQSGQGSASNRITDAWVYIGGEINGVYELPITFPIIETGEQDIQIFAGIRNNGIRSNPVIYPFFSPFSLKKKLENGRLDTIKPSTTYFSDAQFLINETFDNTVLFDQNRDNNPLLSFTRADGFEGKSAKISLSKGGSFEKASSFKVPFTSAVRDIFLELNYKTDALLSVGVMNSSTNEVITKITLTPRAEWNKTYINLVNEIRDLRASNYQLILRGVLPDSLSAGTVLIDNVKLIQR